MKTFVHNQLNFGGLRTSEINFENVYQNKTKLQPNCFSGFKISTVLFILLNLFAINNVVGQTKTWNGSSSTSWTDNANWTPSGVPTSVNDVIIPNVSQDPRYDGSGLTVKSITVQNGGNLVFQRSNNYSLTVTNNVDVNAGGLFGIRTGGNSATSTLTIGGNLTNAGTMDFTDGTTSVVNITFNSTSQTISGAGTYDLNNITTSGAGSLTLSTSSIFINSFSLNSGKTFALGTNTFTVGGSWTNNGGTLTGTGIVTLDGTGTIGGTSSTTFPNLTISGTIAQGINTIVSGNYNQTGGTYTQNAGATAYSLTVSGDFTLSGVSIFNMQTTSNGAGATTTVNGATGTTISGTASLIMDSGGAAVANVSIFQTKNFTSTATTSGTGKGIIDFGNRNNTKNNEFRVSGNFSKTGTTGRFYTNATPVNGGFVFNGSGTTQTVSIVASSSTEYYNVTVNFGAVVQLTSALTLGTASNPASSMTVIGTLDAQTFSIIGGNSGVFTLASGSTLKTANVNGVVSGTIGTISTSIPTRTFTSPNYIFSGSANQTANFGNTTINNLTISNTGGSVTLNAAITANDITINSGGGSLTVGSFTHLVAGNWTNDGGTFVPGTGTISLNGTAQAIGGTSSSINFNNLSLSGGTKTFNKLVAVSGNLSIASGALANPGALTTHTAGTLTLGGITTVAAKFGSTSTAATPTVYKTDTYFTAGTTGYITVSSGNCTTAITVASITSNNVTTSLAKNGDVITVSFTTSEIPSATPTATINGSTATVSGSGTSWSATKTVSGDTNGLATFSISIQNAFGCTASRTTVTNGSAVTVDTVAPTIPSISIASNNTNTSLARSGNIITLSFTTSETPSTSPTATINGASATVSGSGTSYTATRTVAGGDTNGVVPFSISIRDAAGNTASGTATTNSSAVTVDTAVPTIPTGAIASNNATTTLAKSGDVITVSFTTSETPAGTPSVTISGGTATVSGSGTSYTATRTVLSGDANGVAPFSISIADAAGNTASRTTVTNGSSVTVDTVAPTIPTATIASNNAIATLAKAGNTITLSFTTSQTPAATPIVTINGASATVSGSGTSYSATRIVAGGDTNGIAPFSISIADAAGNTASRTTVSSGSSVTVDTVAPTIPTISIASNNANISLARTGNIITVSFTTSETPSATPTATISGGAAVISGSGTSYTATRTVAGGDANGIAPFSISIRDAAGNTASGTATTNSSSVTVDTSAPTIPTASIASNNASITLAKSGDIITVSFTTSETPAATPSVTISGGAASVSGSGTFYTATRVVAGGDTNGVAQFSISIADAAGNTASRTSTTDGSSVTVDTAAPTFTTISIASNNANTSAAGTGDVITLSFTTSELIVTTPVVIIEGATVAVSGSGTSWTATKTVTSCSGNVVTFSINLSDPVGNGASSTVTTDASQVTINPTPSATIVSNGGTICSGFNATFIVNGSNGATLNYTITGQALTQQLVLTGSNQVITASNATSDVTLTLISIVNANCSSATFATDSSTVTVNPLPIVTASDASGCSGSSIALSGSGTPIGGSGSYSVANPYVGTVSTTYTYTYTDLNNCSATSALATITVTAQPLWYLDADGDHYYSVGVPSCDSPGAGYTQTGLLGGGDCVDSPSDLSVNPLNVLPVNIHPGLTEVCYNNVDDNCNDTKSEGCAAVPVTVVNGSPASFSSFSCSFYTYPGATTIGYQIEIERFANGVSAGPAVTLPVQTSRFFSIPVNMRVYTTDTTLTTYKIRASAVINGEVVGYSYAPVTFGSYAIPKSQLSTCPTTL
ncbi:MopE-related protein, partial [Flavobacterium paronense]